MNPVASIAPRLSKRASILTATAIAIAQVLLSVTSSAASASAPVIGLLLSTNEPSHLAVRQAADFALERRHRLGLPPLRLQVRSGDGQWGSAADDTARLVFEDAASLLIAPPGGSITHLILQVSGRTRIPVISLNGDASVSGAGIPWMLRLVPTTRDQARCLLPLSKRWTFVVPPERDGRQMTSDLCEQAQNLGLSTPRVVVASTPFNQAQLDEALAPNPEALLLWLPASAAAQWSKALRARGFRGTLAGPCSLRASLFTELAGASADGFLIARLQSLASPGAVGQDFDRDYRARFGTSPDELAWFAADAIDLAARWLTTPDLAAGRDLGMGLTGPWQFSPMGDRLGSLEIHQFEHQQWRRCEPSVPAGTSKEPSK